MKTNKQEGDSHSQVDVGHIYFHGGGLGIARDYKEVPTNIKQTIHASKERIDELMENPGLIATQYPFIAKKLRDKVKMRVLGIMEEVEASCGIEDVNGAEGLID